MQLKYPMISSISLAPLDCADDPLTGSTVTATATQGSTNAGQAPHSGLSRGQVAGIVVVRHSFSLNSDSIWHQVDEYHCMCILELFGPDRALPRD